MKSSEEIQIEVIEKAKEEISHLLGQHTSRIFTALEHSQSESMGDGKYGVSLAIGITPVRDGYAVSAKISFGTKVRDETKAVIISGQEELKFDKGDGEEETEAREGA